MKALIAALAIATIATSAAAYDMTKFDKCADFVYDFSKDRRDGKMREVDEIAEARDCVRVMNVAFKEAGMPPIEFTPSRGAFVPQDD